MDELTESEISNLKKDFISFDEEDEEKDGTISAEEVATVLRYFGDEVSEEWIQGVISTLDVDWDGTIGFNKFVIVMARSKSTITSDANSGQRNIQKQIKKALAGRQKIRENLRSLDKVVVVVKY